MGEKGEGKRKVKGTRMGRVVRGNRTTRINYVQCRTNLPAWRNKLDDSVDPGCHAADVEGRYAETGKHVALVCSASALNRPGQVRRGYSLA